MIKLRINGKRRQVPTANELTVKQWLKYSGTSQDIYNYIAVALDMPAPDLQNSTMRGIGTPQLFAAKLGIINPWNERAYVTNVAKQYSLDAGLNGVKLNKTGHRWMFEAYLTEKPTDNDAALFCLAMAVRPGCFDIEQIKQTVKSFDGLLYVAVMPVAVFFFKNVKAIHYDGHSLLRRYLNDTRQLILNKKKLRDLVSLESTVLSMKWREFVAILIYRIRTRRE